MLVKLLVCRLDDWRAKLPQSAIALFNCRLRVVMLIKAIIGAIFHNAGVRVTEIALVFVVRPPGLR